MINEYKNRVLQVFLAKIKADSLAKMSEDFIKSELDMIIQMEDIVLPPKAKIDLLQKLIDELLGLGPLEALLRDDEVSEIMVNGKDTIYIEKKGVLSKSEITFVSNDLLLRVIRRIVSQVGRRIDQSSPMVDARLVDGSRINAIIPPLSLNGPVLTIRKFPREIFKISKILEYQTANEEMLEVLNKCVKKKWNIIISGGTGSGKTSTLNALANLVPVEERIVSIEDSAEMKIDHPHLVSLESRPINMEGKGEVSIRDLVKNALRMRPDRIIVGEIRGGEALDMLQAMNTGHKGSISTVHANSPLEALYRIETMSLMSKVELPLKAIRSQIVQAVDLIIQIQRLADGSRKITAIAALDKTKFQNAEYVLDTWFSYDFRTQTFKKSKKTPEQINNLY